MSIWGKILGGAAGFALGGPLGALIGAVAGHAVDAALRESQFDFATSGGDKPLEEDGREATRQIAFTIAVIVLGAKMAKADGNVSRAEVDAFKQVFRVPPQELGNVGRLFDRARADSSGFEPYARQVARMFRNHPKVLEELIDGLFHIAKADGQVKPGELEFLRQITEIFGFTTADFDRIRAGQLGPDAADPYAILGIDRRLSDAEVKAAYRKLIRETHPDRLVAQGLPPEFIAVANDKMATINAAYDRIAKERGIG